MSRPVAPEVTAPRAANLALKFLLELAAIAAFAVWGADVGDGISTVLLAVAAAVAAVVLWGVLAAPRSPRRLPAAARVPFELGFFALAFLALLAVGLDALAIVFGVAVSINALLLGASGDWRE